MFICKSSSPNWTVNETTVTVTSSDKFDGHDEVSVIDGVVLRFNKCVNNTEYGCDDDDMDFHDSAIVYCKGLLLCVIVYVLIMLLNTVHVHNYFTQSSMLVFGSLSSHISYQILKYRKESLRIKTNKGFLHAALMVRLGMYTLRICPNIESAK